MSTTSIIAVPPQQQKQQPQASNNNNVSSSSSDATGTTNAIMTGMGLVDLWSQYWNGNPLLDVWHCQTFARMTAKSFSETTVSNWSPEIKKMLETVCLDLRMKQVRTFFSRQQQKQQQQGKNQPPQSVNNNNDTSVD